MSKKVMKKKDNENVLDIAREHLGSIDLICRLLFSAVNMEGFILDCRAIGHLAALLYQFRKRHAEILSKEGV